MSYGNYETLIVERQGHVGWLIFDRPEQLNAMNNTMRDELADAWIELDRDPEVRVIVHTGNGRAFQTGVDVMEIADRRHRLRALPRLDGALRRPLHRVAPARVEAGDLRGQRHLRRRRVPLGGRLRHRDRRVRRAVLRPARVGRSGGRDRGHRADPAHAGRGRDAHGVRRQVRAHDRPAGLRARDDQPDRRPARAPPRRGPEAGRDRSRRTPRPPCATRRRRSGARSRPGSPTPARHGAKHLVDMWGHPDQEEGPAAFAEKRDANWAPLSPSA